MSLYVSQIPPHLSTSSKSGPAVLPTGILAFAVPINYVGLHRSEGVACCTAKLYHCNCMKDVFMLPHMVQSKAVQRCVCVCVCVCVQVVYTMVHGVEC